jgi:hypothetical protein
MLIRLSDRPLRRRVTSKRRSQHLCPLFPSRLREAKAETLISASD